MSLHTDTVRAHDELLAKLGEVAANFVAHVRSCDKRGARLEKATWLGISVMIGVLGWLAAAHFGKL